MYRVMSKQFIALFAGLLVLYSIQFISPPKMRGLILRRKTGTVSVEVFTFHVHSLFSPIPQCFAPWGVNRSVPHLPHV